MKLLPFVLTSLFFALTSHGKEPSYEILSYSGQDLFPSAIISTATVDWSAFEENTDEEEEESDPEPENAEVGIPVLGDTNAWLGVRLSDVPPGADILVEISGDGWLKPSRFRGKAEDAEGKPISGDIEIMPKGVWDYDALGKTREQKPVNLTAKVTINGKELTEQSETFVMRSMNDCPFFIIHPSDEGEENFEDISWSFAAYVNENHPWIDGLLKEALTTAKNADGEPLINSFDGYQSGDTENVLKQVFAIWQVLQRRGIKYSDVSTTVPSKTVVSQVVRFVDETVDAKQANCVDGSVLMASILTKIGLNAYLVMVPGHCFLAFDGDEKGESTIGLETTLLGEDNLTSVEELKNVQKQFSDKEIDMEEFNSLVAEEAEASMLTFLNAIEAGNASLEEHAEAFEEASDPSIQLISISEWREHGIRPLASGKERR